MRSTVLLSLLAGLSAATAPAHADMLDEVIGFYNPDLRPARPVIECVLSGTPLQTCVLDAGKAALVDEYVDGVLGALNPALDDEVTVGDCRSGQGGTGWADAHSDR